MALISESKSHVLVCSTLDPIKDVVEAMARHLVGSILVMDHAHKIQGIVTERDVLKHWSELSKVNFLIKPITRMMSSPVHTLQTFDFVEAAKIMTEKKIRHIPVVDSEDSLCGIISMRDVVAYFNKVGVQASSIKSTSSIDVNSGKHSKVMHLITPVGPLRTTLSSLLPVSWELKVHDMNAIQKTLEDPDSFSNPKHAFFLDLDGLQSKDWRELLKIFIKNLSRHDQPKIFLAWTHQLMDTKDIENLEAVAKTAEWYLFQKPLSIGELSMALNTLSK